MVKSHKIDISWMIKCIFMGFEERLVGYAWIDCLRSDGTSACRIEWLDLAD